MTRSHTVLQTRILNASVQDVWAAWTRPDLMKQWFCPLGMTAADVEADVQVGGAFRIVMDPEGTDIQRPPGVGELLIAHGTYQLILPPQKLVFSWAWEGREEVSRVSISMRQIGEKTELTLVHDGLASEDCRTFHENGWIPTLENLAQHLGKKHPAVAATA